MFTDKMALSALILFLLPLFMCTDANEAISDELNDISNISGQNEIGKWERFVVSCHNPSFSGNPFELEMSGEFTHSSGIQISLPGYYDGSDTWKIGFMPTKIGAWSYTTSSADPELNSCSGSIVVNESDLPGMLQTDTKNPTKWRYSEGGYVVPIALRMEIFSEPASIKDFISAAEYLRNHNVNLVETRLLEEYGQWGGRHDYIFQGDWQNHEFDLEVWRRFEQRLQVLTELGLGAHIMFYSDDGGKPGWEGMSPTEALVIRYTIARTAGFPVIFYNTGIDISEYRSCDDINWIGEEIDSYDPYDHPRSSRWGGGSGDCIMENQLFDSNSSFTTAEVDPMIDLYISNSIPISLDDGWGENRTSHPSKNHSEHDIRRAFWKTVISGGVGGLIRGGGNGGCFNGFMCIKYLEQEWESEQWIKLINPFIEENLGSTFGSMDPAPALVSGSKVYALADSTYSKIVILNVGVNDKYDAGNGGSMTLKLTDFSGVYSARWFDTRSGKFINIGKLDGGKEHKLNPPNSDDWILLLIRESLDVSRSCYSRFCSYAFN